MKQYSRFFLTRGTQFVALALMCCALVWGQSERGSIRGTIEDSSGAGIPGVAVTAVNVGTGVRTATTTSEAGNYNIPQLPPGNYSVEVEQTGFKKLTQENVA